MPSPSSATDFLLDTDVLSETAKTAPDENVVAWLHAQDSLHLSTISIFEIARGIHALPRSKKRTFLEAWFAALLEHAVIHDFDRAAALFAANLDAHTKRRGRSVDLRDMFILAISRTKNLGIATRNARHFTGHGVVIFDPFKGEETL
jgi:predicted nucleic acid-binding protein